MLFATLPTAIVPGPGAVRYVVPVLEVALGVVLIAGNRRRGSIALIALIGVANAITLGYLIHELLYSGASGRTLLYAAFDVWVTNVIVFALLYWELDGQTTEVTDFAFVQMTDPEVEGERLASALHRLPLRLVHERERVQPDRHDAAHPRAKMLMLVQSALSIVTLLLVAARAVNILR